ncbi:maleate cis-trans isomerase family protein [Ancylobacter sp.]|uniref:maleate cis-trans isomerase family protein n=1 Tax=Ancylobacter sp. TaxID=1872567 RepID=UPI003D0B6EB3
MQNVVPSPRHLIGMLTPSSNTVLEPYTARMLEPLFPKVSAHFGRFRVTRIALDDSASEQFRQEPILAAAELLADAHTDIIAWNGTSASWLGFDTDERLCAEIHARTGVKATSAILSLNRLIAARGVKRLGLVTPYTGDVGERIVANYASIGVEVVAGAHCGLSDNFSFAEIDEDRIGQMCAEVSGAAPDAIAIVCTNMRGALVGAQVERALGIPVFDSVSTTLWGCLQAMGVATDALAPFGSLFAAPPPAGMARPAR